MTQALSAIQFDALREICSIGTAHAATALSQMLNKRVNLEVPNAALVEGAELAQSLGDDPQPVLAIWLQILGDARGHMLFVFPWDSALNMLETLLPSKERAMPLSELELSCLREVGNIVASSFLNALGSLLKFALIPSIPKVYIDRAGMVAQHFMVDASGEDELTVFAETSFFVEGRVISGNLYLFPSSRSLPAILGAVGINQA